MKIKGFVLWWTWALLFFIPLTAQPNDGKSNTFQDSLWLNVDSTLQGMENDTSWYFIIEKVRSECENEYECLYENYLFLQTQTEREFYLPVALYLAREIARISEIAEEYDHEAKALIDQYRFYHALGDKRNCMICLDRAMEILEKSGNESKLSYVKMIQLELSAELIPIEEILPELDKLLEQAKKRGDEESVFLLHVNLIQMLQDYGLFKEMEPHIQALEKIAAVKEGIDQDRILVRTTLGRAAMARGLNDPDEAVNQYRRTLEKLGNIHDKWLDVFVHQNLAELEWERKNHKEAWKYLTLAEQKTQDPNLFERKAENFRLKARFTEEEGRYEEALNHFKEQLYHQNLWESKSKGFSMQAYLLEKEKEKMASERERQNLVIQLKENQLKYSRIWTLFVLTLAGVLVLGLLIYRKRKKDLEKLNSTINQQSEQLRNLDKNKSRFFANISHELRTPLTLILGPLGTILKSNSLDPKNIALIRTAHQNANKLLKLVGSILDLSKMEHGKLVLKETPVSLYDLVRRTIASFESHAEQKGIRLHFHYMADKDLKVLLDGEKVVVILNNLISNALKFTERNDIIELKIEDKGKSILLAIKDNGRGVSNIDLPFIFDRYYQSVDPEVPIDGGTGVGLAYSKEIVQLMKGQIWVDSKKGEGSIFYIEIPKTEVLGASQMLHEEPEAESLGEGVLTEVIQSTHTLLSNNQQNKESRQSILIVEDNFSLRDYLNSILISDYNTHLAANGKEALDILQGKLKEQGSGLTENGEMNEKIDLIISDIMMPVMDGFQFLEKLKSMEEFRTLPLLMLTARADAKDKLRALRMGVDDYLLKPFQEEEIRVRIQNLLINAANRSAANEDYKRSKEQWDISEEDKLWLETFESFIRSNIANDIINVYYIADHFAMSESTLLRQLKRLTGLTPKKYLQQMRLEHGRHLLETGKYRSIAEVSRASGYNDPRSFCRSFKKLFGIAPSECK